MLLLLLTQSLGAEETKFPSYSGYVNDYANLLTPSDKAKLTSFISELETKTTAQVAVLTLGTTQPLEIESYAVELFEQWGIGQKDKDNGVLILVAVDDRAVRIETGYGLEGVLPDAVCNQIIYQLIIPNFKKGDYSQGITMGTVAVVDLVAKEYKVELTAFESTEVPMPQVRPGSPLAAFLRTVLLLIFFVVFIGLRAGLLWFLLLPNGRRRGGYWFGGGYGGNSGGFSGGFGGFGGGLSGGGGASGRW